MRRLVPSTMVLTLAASALCACGGHEALEKAPTPVRVLTAIPSPAGAGVRYSASLEAKDQVPVAFKQSGYLREILQVRGLDGRPRDLHEGDRVEKGTVLARLRETEYEDSVTAAQSQVAEATASLVHARQDFGRAEALYKATAMTQPDYDAARRNLDVAQARVEGAQAQLQTARTSLGDCALKAPLTGVVTSAGLEVGQLVTPGAVAFSLADTTSVKAVFGVSDVMLKDMKLGGALAIATESIPGIELQGRITRISPSADPKSRVFEVELTIPNPDARLKPGMIAGLRAEVGRAPESAASDGVPAVRLSSIVRPPAEKDGYAVFVVEDEGGRPVARVRKVSLGEAVGNLIAVTSGLKIGERVIVIGATLVTDGEPVRLVP
jgi:RND family efflux transporter MFP subunit